MSRFWRTTRQLAVCKHIKQQSLFAHRIVTYNTRRSQYPEAERRDGISRLGEHVAVGVVASRLVSSGLGKSRLGESKNKTLRDWAGQSQSERRRGVAILRSLLPDTRQRCRLRYDLIARPAAHDRLRPPLVDVSTVGQQVAPCGADRAVP